MKRTVNQSAHGRVNLIGDHTDYNLGFVLPTIIPQKTTVEATLRTDKSVILTSTGRGTARFELGQESPQKHWSDYAQGVTWVLSRQGFSLQGMDLQIDSSVPIGSGLSSSAAFCVALIRAIRELQRLDIAESQMPALCQSVENDFVGARVGIMDPMACSLARPGFALFVDTQDLSTRQIKIPDSVELVTIHSGISHGNAAGGYNIRRSQCEEAAHTLGVRSLRALSVASLAAARSQLPETLYKRVQHVVTENQRVLDFIAAMQKSDPQAMGGLLSASHRSLQFDYEVSVPEVDMLVDILSRKPGIFGARMTGGGFGGSIVALASPGRGEAAARQAMEEYARKTGHTPTLILPTEESQ